MNDPEGLAAALALAVRVVEGFEDIEGNDRGGPRRESRAADAETMRQARDVEPTHVLHRHEQPAFVDPDVEHLDDVGVAQLRGDRRPTQEELTVVRVAPEMRGDALQGDE